MCTSCVPFFVSLIIDDLGLFRLVGFASFMTFYTFFREEKGLLLIDYVHCTLSVVDDSSFLLFAQVPLFPRTPRACRPLLSACVWAASVGASSSSTGTTMATPLWVWCTAPATASFCWPSGEGLGGEGCRYLPQTVVGRRASVRLGEAGSLCAVGEGQGWGIGLTLATSDGNRSN